MTSPLFSATLRPSTSCPASVGQHQSDPSAPDLTTPCETKNRSWQRAAPTKTAREDQIVQGRLLIGELWDTFFNTPEIPGQKLLNRCSQLHTLYVNSNPHPRRLARVIHGDGSLHADAIRELFEEIERTSALSILLGMTRHSMPQEIVKPRRLFSQQHQQLSMTITRRISVSPMSLLGKIRDGEITIPRVFCIPRFLQEHKEGIDRILIQDANLLSLPDYIGEFAGLTHLDIAFNAVSSLPRSLLNLQKLQELIVMGNPLVDDEESREIILQLREKGVKVIDVNETPPKKRRFTFA